MDPNPDGQIAGISTKRTRHTFRWVAVLLVALWILAAGALTTAGALNLREGNRAVDEAREKDFADVARDGPLPELRRAEQNFSQARSRFRSPVLAPVRVLPILGRQVRSATALSSAAGAAARAADEAVVEAQRVVQTGFGTGPQRVDGIRTLSEIARRMDRRLSSLDLGPRTALIGPLDRGRRGLVADVVKVRDGLGRASAGATAMADLLEGPRAYLVFAANNAEMRAGSGMFLSVGRMESAAGAVRVTEMSSVTDVAVPAGVPVSGDLAARWGWLRPETDWRNLMLSPRFDASASLAASMWTSAGRPPVDGVMALDPVALEAILEATGPVDIGGRQFTAENVVEELIHTQYTRFPDLTERDERREQLSAIARAALDALERTEWEPARLADRLARAARGRHLMVWSSRPPEQKGWVAAGLAGTVGPESLLVSLLNRGGNKLDYWVATSATLELTPTGDDTEAKITVEVRNEVPGDEPSYVAGPHFGIPLARGEYLGLLAVTLPGAAAQGRLEGMQLAVAGADGPTRVVASEFRLSRGATRTIVVRFRLPGRGGEIRVEPSARQLKTVAWRFRDRTWRDDRPFTVRW